MSLAGKLASKLNKLSHGTSRLIVRDSYRYAASTMIGLITLAASLCLGNDTYATSSSITVTLGNNVMSLNVAPSGKGVFAKSGTNVIGVSTSNYTGYTLSITSQNQTNPTALINEDDDTKILPSISTIITEDAFRTSEDSDYINRWGYSPSRYCTSGESGDCVDNENFLPSPDADGDVLDITTVANEAANEYELTIGTKINNEAALGSYSNTYLVSAVANAIPYNIAYDPNTMDTVTGMPSDTSGSTYNDTVILDTAVPARDEYGFVGWCTVAVSDNGTCSGAKYNPGDTYPIDQTTANNDITLYAMWGGCSNLLYDLVACQVKTSGDTELTQSPADLRAEIGEPTSNDPAIDSSNSGVYKYDADIYGIASDMNYDYNIYYFRGILDKTYTDSDVYGGIPFTGGSEYYQNYVKLSNVAEGKNDTCWRIVRTTGSGGTKMIYNGVWDSANHTCANSLTEASSYGLRFNYPGNSVATYWMRNINRVGYTFNDDPEIQDVTQAKSVDVVFGSNQNYSTINFKDSNIKSALEKWFNNTVSAYESIIEPSAGYCNDRTLYSTINESSAISTVEPYTESGDMLYFGSYLRNGITNNNATPSLACSRGVVDLYSSEVAGGGNGQLYKPIALLTADEAALAGSGYGESYSSNYSYQSYLRSGANYWLLSPINRTRGLACMFLISYNGSFTYYDVSSGTGDNMRPVISLASETTVVGGSGTAVDPWAVSVPVD